METIKQVIVMRNDLNMRKGKMIAQGSHASMSFLVKRLQGIVAFTKEENIWMAGAFTKVCVKCGSKEELFEIFQKAKDADLEVHLITDSGKTEFNGVPTETCLAIGPDLASKIDPITGGLGLL